MLKSDSFFYFFVVAVNRFFHKYFTVLSYFCIILTETLEEMTINNCNDNDNEVCHSARLTERESAVVCITNDVTPAVDITWQTLDGRSTFPDASPEKIISNVNDSLPLSYTMFVHRYDPSSFSLQYFTCAASGIAVKDISSASLLVEGDKPYDDVTNTHAYVREGESLSLQCPRDKYPFGLLNATFSNGTSSVLFDWNLLSGMQCLSPWECEISSTGLTTIILPADDIAFTCISSSGTMTYKDVTYSTNSGKCWTNEK